MRLRVCILARENVLHWTPHYIDAFRQRCEVMVIGPPLDRSHLVALGWQDGEAFWRPNDIRTENDDLPEVLSLLPQGWRPDLIVVIQSGGPAYKRVASLAIPTVYLSVDTWHDHEEFHYARDYDFIFAAQKVFPSYFRANGALHTFWLPLACDPAYHHPVAMEKDLDIVFVGATHFVVNEERMQRLHRLAKHFRAAQLSGVGGDCYCQTMSRAHIAFNSSIAQDINMRVFEALSMGCPLLTNRDAQVNGLFELFEDETHLLTYEDGDLVEKTRHLLESPDLREGMAQAGRALVLDRHTYVHRIDSLLQNLREQIPQLGDPPQELFRNDTLRSWLPFGVKRVLDAGLALRQSKVALRRKGVEWLGGLCQGDPHDHPRKGSYDALFEMNRSWPKDLSCDALLWAHPLLSMGSLDLIFERAKTALVSGGVLVLQCREEEIQRCGLPADEASWNHWSYDQGFHLILWRAPEDQESNWILVFKRYERCLHAISQEIYERFPGGELSKRRPSAQSDDPASN